MHSLFPRILYLFEIVKDNLDRLQIIILQFHTGLDALVVNRWRLLSD
jgi:hypothetical protein